MIFCGQSFSVLLPNTHQLIFRNRFRNSCQPESNKKGYARKETIRKGMQGNKPVFNKKGYARKQIHNHSR